MSEAGELGESGGALAPGAVFRVPLGDGTCGLGQVIAVEGGAVAIGLSDGVWTCEPGLLDWAHSGRALPHMVLRPAGLAGVAVVGTAEVDEAAQAAHARWQAGDRAVVAAPPAAILSALLG